MKIARAVAVLLVASVAMADQTSGSGFKSPRARSAKAKFDLVVQKASDLLRQESKDAIHRYIVELTVVRTAALRAGKLDDANAIDKQIKSAESGDALGTTVMIGSEWKAVANISRGKVVTIDCDATLAGRIGEGAPFAIARHLQFSAVQDGDLQLMADKPAGARVRICPECHNEQAALAQKKFDTATTSARETWKSRVSPARQTYITDLQSAKVSSMKLGDLDETNAIDAEIHAQTISEDVPTFGTKVWLSDIDPVGFEGAGGLGRNGKWYSPFEKREVDWIATLNGENPVHFLHALPKSDGVGAAAYNLNRGYDTISGTAAINDAPQSRHRTATPLIFKVVGDGKLLWRSKPLQEPGDQQSFTVSVVGVSRLGLVVECAGPNTWASAVWVNPTLTR